MKPVLAVRATLLSVAISLTLAGCGGENGNEMSQEEIQYISHLDQSRFFQRQGELKASTLEARSAIELQPEKLEPYFLIIDNLLKAGDAVNAERQLDWVMEQIPEEELSAEVKNRASLILAEASLMQGEYGQALAELEGITSPDRPVETRAALLEGEIYLASDRLEEANAAFEKAREIDPGAVESVIGLSKTAFAKGEKEKALELVAEAEEINGEHTELWLWKAQMAHAEKEWSKAEDSYIRALEDIGQYDVMTQRKYTTISALIRVLRAQGKQSEAFVYEEILAKSAPGTIKSNLVAAQEAMEEGDLNTAARYLEEVLAQAPSHEQSALMLGLVRFRQGRVEEAEKLLAPVAEMGDSEVAGKLLAATRLQMRNPQGAQDILDTLEDKDSDPETLALVAIASLASGDAETGEALMEKALELNPDNHQLRLRYAAYLNRKGEHSRAIDLITQVRNKAPDLDQARTLLIQTQASSGDMSAAVNTASQWIKDEPDNVDALVIRGNLSASENNMEEARKYFTQALNKHPEALGPIIALGRLALSQENLDEAQKQFRRAVELAPDSRQALQGLTAVLDQEETERFMREVLENNPDATGPRLILLELALREGKTQEADDLTASLLERDEENTPSRAAPLVANIYNTMAARIRETGEADRATVILNRARALFPENEEISLQAAQQAFIAEDTDEARSILQEAKQQHPDSPRPYLIEARYFESLGEYQQAAEFYQLAMDKQSSAGIINAYAAVLQAIGKEDDALSLLESGVDSYPGNVQLRLRLALLQQSEGEKDKAKANYEKILDSMPENTVVLNNLAWLYHETGDERAVSMAKKAYDLAPESAAIVDTYGWIMLKAGKSEESLPILKKAHELQPDSEEIALHLAEAYRAVGRNADAQRILEKFGDQG
ncbi:tetratricopeptide repeat protein [Marinobacter sp. SS13-12]|uniref:tetratricopeptide repeat protein n=1 Tax=Marinobacter sp. SS13-12 TaxID=3050451 RepID=UPI002554CABC|nr:tetratricopeptide repeat protein [Marinobacter sp. SS13-12]MDK8464282.1 tetratricopeptide repeat protein [Marinobacter sp. SS13-12]